MKAKRSDLADEILQHENLSREIHDNIINSSFKGEAYFHYNGIKYYISKMK